MANRRKRRAAAANQRRKRAHGEVIWCQTVTMYDGAGGAYLSWYEDNDELKAAAGKLSSQDETIDFVTELRERAAPYTAHSRPKQKSVKISALGCERSPAWVDRMIVRDAQAREIWLCGRRLRWHGA